MGAIEFGDMSLFRKKERAKRSKGELSSPHPPSWAPSLSQEGGRGQKRGGKKQNKGQAIPHDPTSSNQTASHEGRREGQGRGRWSQVAVLQETCPVLPTPDHKEP